MRIATRPTVIGETGKGKPAYSGPAVAAYRAYHGISQQDVASRMSTTRYAIAMAEGRDLIGERVARRILNEVDYLARLRAETRRAGIAAMQAMRDPDDEAVLLVERVLDHVTDEPKEIDRIAAAIGEERPSDDMVQALIDLYIGGHIERVNDGWRRVAR